MRRRRFLAALGGATAAGPMPARAQAPARTYRLAHLTNSAASEAITREIALPELARLGFAPGRNLVFEGRVGDSVAMPRLMGELLAARPDAVMAVGPVALAAAAAATRTLPIVGFGPDAIELGLAQSYARPGGNVTGVVILIGELEAKRLSILRETVPERRRLGALISVNQVRAVGPALRKAAAALDVEIRIFAVAAPADYAAAFAAMRGAGVEALLIGAAPEFFRDGKRLAAMALEARLPTVCEWGEMADDGCMIGYGPNRVALRKRAAAQIALIFRGTPAGEIAIETPTLFEFAVNRKVAKALGVAIPSAVLAGADKVIE